MPLDSTTPMDDQKSKALAAALAQIEKQFGKGSIMKMGDAQIAERPAGRVHRSLGLDIALGVGGLPRGRVVEIYGPESSGKTTLCLQVVAQVQKAGGIAAYIDAENALDPVYAGKLGVNVGDLLISQPDTGEQALEIADMLVRSGGVDVIVVDSVAALVPKAEIEGEMGDQLPGLQARLMSQALRKLTGNIKRANTLVIFINQIRMKIGVMFGNPETTTGGNALKFYASVRLDIRRIGAIKRGEEVVGNETRVKVVKNKVAPPFREALFDILYGEGISREGEIVELGVIHRIVEKSGAWYAYDGEKIGQGKDNAREYLREHPGDRRGNRGQDPRGGQRAHAPAPAARSRLIVFRARRGARPRGGEPSGPEGSAPPAPSLRSMALRLLARRDWAREELAARLRARGGEETDIAATLDDLTALGFLSDARYAEALVSSRRGTFGRRAIAQTLKERRIAPHVAQAAMEPLATVDETADALALWQRRFGAVPRDAREKARQVRFLMARGYPLGVALKVLRVAGAPVDEHDQDG